MAEEIKHIVRVPGPLMFVVVRWGINMQGIYGVFGEPGDALVHAVSVCHQEPDDYHTFQVIPFEANKGYINTEGAASKGARIEMAAFCTVSREDDKVTVEFADGTVMDGQ